MEYTDTQDDFVDETIDNETRKRKTPESDKKTKPKWKSSEIETLIDELEKRSCLWDVFDKDYHNRDKRDVAYTELAEILSYNKQEVKTKIAGPRTQLGRELSKTNSWKSGQATSEKYKSTWVFFDKLQFLRPVTQAAKSKDNLSLDHDSPNGTLDEFDQESLPSSSPSETFESTPRISKKARKSMDTNKENFLSTCVEVLRETTCPQPVPSKEQCSFSKYVSEKLATFDKRSRMIAEKRISDVLFEIEMNSHNTMNQVQEYVAQGHSAGTYMSLLRDGF